MFLGIGLAHATSNRTALRQRISHAITHHTILIFLSFQTFQIIGQNSKTFATVEIIGINNGKWLFKYIFTHQHGMISSPRFSTSLGTREALRQIVDRLEYQFTRNMTFIFRKNLIPEILLEILTNYENDFTESSA